MANKFSFALVIAFGISLQAMEQASRQHKIKPTGLLTPLYINNKFKKQDFAPSYSNDGINKKPVGFAKRLPEQLALGYLYKQECSIAIIDAQEGTIKHTMRIPQAKERLQAFDWSPDGQFIAYALADKKIYVYSPEQRSVIAVAEITWGIDDNIKCVEGQEPDYTVDGVIASLIFAPSNNFLFITSDDSCVRLWSIDQESNLLTGSLIYQASYGGTCPNAIFSNTGKYIAVLCQNTVVLCDVTAQKVILKREINSATVQFSEDDQTFAWIDSATKKLYFMALNGNLSEKDLAGYTTEEILHYQLTHDFSKLIVCLGTQKIIIISLNSENYEFVELPKYHSHFSLNNAGTILATVSHDECLIFKELYVDLWDMNTNTTIKRLIKSRSGIQRLQFNSTGTMLVLVGNSGTYTINLPDLDTAEQQCTSEQLKLIGLVLASSQENKYLLNEQQNIEYKALPLLIQQLLKPRLSLDHLPKNLNNPYCPF